MWTLVGRLVVTLLVAYVLLCALLLTLVGLGVALCVRGFGRVPRAAWYGWVLTGLAFSLYSNQTVPTEKTSWSTVKSLFR